MACATPLPLAACASADCRELHSEIQDLEQRLAQLRSHIQAERRSCGDTQQRAHHISLEMQHSQAKVDECESCLQTESHLLGLAQCEATQLRREAANERAQQEALDEHAAALEVACLRAEDEVQRIASVQLWTQQEMQIWAQAEQARVQERLELEISQRRDDRAIAALTTQLEQASLAVSNAERSAEAQSAEAQVASRALERAHAELRCLRAQRSELWRQWESAATPLRQRTAAVLQADSELATGAHTVAALRQQETAAAEMHGADEAAGAALETLVADLERKHAQLAKQHTAARAAAQEQAERTHLAQLNLNRLQLDVHRQRTANARRQHAAQNAATALADAMRQRDGLYAELALREGEVGSTEEQCAALDAIVTEQRRKLAALDRQLTEVDQQQVTASRALQDARKRSRQLQSEIVCAKSLRKNLHAKLAALDRQRAQAEDVCYRGALQAATAQRAAARAGGERSDAESAALREQIAALKAGLEAVAAYHKEWKGKVCDAEAELGRASRDQSQLQAEAAAQCSEVQRSGLAAAQAQRALDAAVEARNATLVQVNMATAQVHGLQVSVVAAAQHAAAEEILQDELQGAVAAQRAEMQAQAEALQSNVQALKGDLHRLTLNQRDLEGKRDNARAKYETVELKTRPPEGKNLTALHIRRREKQAMTVEGLAEEAVQRESALAQEVAATEAAIVDVEQDCELLLRAAQEHEASNAAIRVQGKFGGALEMLEEQEELRKALAAAQAERSSMLQQERRTLEALKQAQQEVEGKQTVYETQLHSLEQLESHAAAAKKQLAEQRGRLERAAERCTAARARLQKPAGAAKLPEGITLEQLEEDIELGEGQAEIAAEQGRARSRCSKRMGGTQPASSA